MRSIRSRFLARTLLLTTGLAASAASAQSDACAGATLIGLGTHSGTTIGATNDGNGNCGSSASSPDVWYKFVASGDDQLIVESCGGAAWDTVLSIHSGCPGNAASVLACNDDDCGLQSRVTANMVAGRTYFIRVSGFGNSAGPFSIAVSLATAPPPPSRGPDVWVAELIDIAYYATAGNTAAYAVGTDACNKGDADAMWISSTNLHPVIAQNLFRLKDGRFEQIGQSWLKHGFASTNSATCGTCQTPAGGGSALGPNCSDAYGAGLNGSQGLLGPRSQVNPATGVFPYPFNAAPYSGEIARRLQVNTADVLPAQNANAQYYAECHYITQDDAQWGNGLNNASYRRVSLASHTAPAFSSSTVPEQFAIHAWRAADPSVTIGNVDYPEPGVAPGSTLTARFIVGAKATNNGNGTWTYEYAVHNVNSNRAAGEFRIPLPPFANVSNIGFHDVPAHSGEPFDGTDWTATVGEYDITWRTTPHATNANANALRWGTLYNFRFTVDVPPATGNLMLGLFRPATAGFPAAVLGDSTVPDPTVCIGDFNRDGGSDGADVQAFFEAWGLGVPAADANADGGVDGADVQVFFERWEVGAC
jgi:hypothetical protein